MPAFDSTLLQNLALVIVYLIGTVIVAWLLALLMEMLVKRFTRHSKTGFDDAIIHAVKRPLVGQLPRLCLFTDV